MKGVIWVRVSSEHQSHGYSPDVQLRELREAAAKRSIEVIKEFKVSESAKTSETRKKFRELLAFIEEHKPEYLIAHAVDRITRNPDDLHTIHRLIESGGLRVFIVSQNKVIDKDSQSGDKFTFYLFGNIAYLDNMQRGERTKTSMLEKARRGIFPSRAPVGYLNIADPSDTTGRRRTVALNPVKGPLVRSAFELYAKGGYSLATLRDELNRRGLHQSPTSKSPKSPTSIYGLQVILGNPFYYGMVRWDKQVFQGTHKPLISVDLFNRVQARLSENRSYMRPAAKKYFAFKPFLKCGYCRSSITAEEQQGQRGKGHYVYYRCTYGKEQDREAKGRKCPQGYFREEKIDAMFAEALGDLYLDESIANKLKELLTKTHADQQVSEKRELQRLQSEYTRKTNHLNLLYQDRLDGVLTKEQYLEKQEAIQKGQRDIKADIEKLGQVNRKYKEEGSTILDLLKGFKKTYLAADLERKAGILNALVDKAVLRGGNLHVFWKPPFDVLFTLGQGVIKKQEWRA